MKHTKLLLITVLMTMAGTMLAQGPNNSGTYYKNADGKKGAELKTALCAIISNPHADLSYNNLWTAFQTTDVRDDGKVWDMYSNTTNFTFGTDQDNGSGGSNEGEKYNREHSFPNSWFGGVKNSLMYYDLYHLYPTDKLVNNKRGNHPFGENKGESYKSNNGFSKMGKCTYVGSGAVTCFEPNDIYKGDFARTYFYMVTRYENELPSWTAYEAYGVTLDGNKYPGLTSWQLKMLMEWSAKDAVSEKETKRLAKVYGIQSNRNPFIDYPGLEEYIWGSMKDVPFSYDNYQTPTAIMTTKADMNRTDGVRYNMAGQTVKDTYKGLVITRGRKILNK